MVWENVNQTHVNVKSAEIIHCLLTWRNKTITMFIVVVDESYVI